MGLKRVSQKITHRIITSLLFRFIDWFDFRNETVTTYKVKKLKSRNQFSSLKYQQKKISNVGIVLQGPIIKNLTLQICQRYISLYPEAIIVLSTWENQQSPDLELIRSLGVDVLENQIPTHRGPGNINLQIASTKAGIDYCLNKKVRFILKNRSDGWLTSDYFIEYLQFMFDAFAREKGKIIVPSYNSFLFRLYSPTDQFQYGTIEVLKDFWDCAYVNENTENFRFAESYLVRNFLKRNNRDVNFTIRDSLEVYRDCFVFAENESLGLVLNKGLKLDVGYRWANDGFPQPMSEIHFWQWLQLQNNMDTYLDYYAALPEQPES